MNNDFCVNQRAWEFFVYESLDIVPVEIFNDGNYKAYVSDVFLGKEAVKTIKDTMNNLDYNLYCVIMCAKAAYYDLCRTLRFKDAYKTEKGKKKDVESKNAAINTVCVELANSIYRNGKIIKKSDELFDFFIDKDGNIKNFGLQDYLAEDFHFGQAQKWINMTLKYLFLLDLIDDCEIHIPIDNYILKALKKDGISIPSKKWSKWEYEEYVGFVDSINTYNIPWEHKAWIRESEIDNKKIEFKREN